MHAVEKSPALAAILGENVRRLRKEQDMNKKLFANMVGIGRPMLDKIENGEADVRLSYVERLASALGASPIELLTKHQ